MKKLFFCAAFLPRPFKEKAQSKGWAFFMPITADCK